MRSLWVLLCALAIPCLSFSQTDQSSWKNLNSLRAGEQITVVAAHSQKYIGTFATVSDDAIKLDGPGGEVTVQRTDVKRVTLQKNKRLRNALILAGVGAGVGAGIGAAVGGNHGGLCCANRAKLVPAFAGALAALGAVIGAAIPSHPTVYRAPH